MTNNFLNIEFKENLPINLFRHVGSYKARSETHRHNCIEIGICLSGGGLFFINNDVYPFMKGSISVAEAGVLHIAQSSAENPSKWIFINVEKSLQSDGFPCIKSGVFTSKKCKFLLECLIEELDNNTKEISKISFMLLELFLIYHAGAVLNPLPLKDVEVSDRLLPALNYIVMYYADELKVSDLAKLCCMSEGAFRRKFKSVLSMSPIEYINTFRIKVVAAMLLTTNKSISEICYDSGFNSISDLNRIFKRCFCVSPREYRKENSQPSN